MKIIYHLILISHQVALMPCMGQNMMKEEINKMNKHFLNQKIILTYVKSTKRVCCILGFGEYIFRRHQIIGENRR